MPSMPCAEEHCRTSNVERQTSRSIPTAQDGPPDARPSYPDLAMYRTEYSPYTRTDTWASGATTIHNGETGDKDDKDDDDDEDDDASVALAAIISRARRNTSARSFRFCFFASSSSDTCRCASRNADTTTDVACCPFLVTGYRPSRTAAPPVASAAHHGCKKGASE